MRKFLGAVTYRARGRPKVVQFWLMNATARPSRDVTKDIAAVEWLPLAMAIRQLSYPLEKLFLNNVGHAILRRKHRPRRKMRAHAAKAKLRRRRSIGKARVARTRTAASRTTAPARQTMLQRVIGRLAR
ncbi:MAG: hypothetical protein ACXWC0_25570 [Burkholderiales bacterium]